MEVKYAVVKYIFNNKTHSKFVMDLELTNNYPGVHKSVWIDVDGHRTPRLEQQVYFNHNCSFLEIIYDKSNT